jgi:hemerythrin-like domain-containing protein
MQKFMDGHAELLSICDHLEHIADTLPHRPDYKKCSSVAANLVPILHDACRYEEDILFPWLTLTYRQNLQLRDSLTRLYLEHVEDSAYAEEVVEMLNLISAQERFEGETAGYMFRGFFEGMRRHIAFERDHLYHLFITPYPHGPSA